MHEYEHTRTHTHRGNHMTILLLRSATQRSWSKLGSAATEAVSEKSRKMEKRLWMKEASFMLLLLLVLFSLVLFTPE